MHGERMPEFFSCSVASVEVIGISGGSELLVVSLSIQHTVPIIM